MVYDAAISHKHPRGQLLDAGAPEQLMHAAEHRSLPCQLPAPSLSRFPLCLPTSITTTTTTSPCLCCPDHDNPSPS
jgi:hypothetical protein